jgi:hypothetical protein
MTTKTTDDCPQQGIVRQRPVLQSVIGVILALATVSAMGALSATPVGATTTGLAQRVVALARLNAVHASSTAEAPRIPGAPNISKVTTTSGNASDSSGEVSSTTSGISATYAGTTLVVHWDTGNSLTVAGAGPLAAGSTVISVGLGLGLGLNVGVGLPGTVAVGGSHPCEAADGFGVVSIQQLVAGPTDTLTSLALQFACLSLSGNLDVIGTVGVNVPPGTRQTGYNLFEGDGSVSSTSTMTESPTGGLFGVDIFGDLSGATLNQPVVGMATTPLDGGYWLVAGDGGVFSFGDAAFYGSTGNIQLNRPVVGMAATPDGKGYWLVASDGGVFSYGDAHFYGSTGNLHLNQPIVGMAATPDGKGYWLVASDGGVFSYGDARFYGSTGSIHLNQPIVGMAPAPSGDGYWLVAADGGIFSFGDARFHGSAGSIHLNSPVVGMAATSDGNGYWIAAADGGVFSYGDAAFGGSLGGTGVDDVAGIAR